MNDKQPKTPGAKVLEPCPFCRSSRVDLSWDLYDTNEGRRHRSQIRCLDCRVLTKTFKTHADARAYWNASASPTEQTPAVGGERDTEDFEMLLMQYAGEVFYGKDEGLDRSSAGMHQRKKLIAYVAPLLAEIEQTKKLLKAYMNAEAEKGIELVKLRARIAELEVQLVNKNN